MGSKELIAKVFTELADALETGHMAGPRIRSGDHFRQRARGGRGS